MVFFMTINLALVGKNIAHSKSSEIYRNLLEQELNYSLLDFSSEKEIPDLKKLFINICGISITSPYKRFFLNQVEVLEKFKKLNAINCVRNNNGKFEAINTDYLAIDVILDEFVREFGDLKVVILGDGVMSKITQILLLSKNISFEVFSRKKTERFELLDLIGLATDSLRPVVINSCSREYMFNGKLDREIIFWDYNYNLEHHKQTISKKVERYIDGYEMLKLQACFALDFWGIKKHTFSK